MTTPALIPDERPSGCGKMAHQVDEADYCSDHTVKIQRSALWAAYGDALGWISELTDESGLLRRTGGEPLRHPIAWKRRIGGRDGVTVSLPAGCYSDDTQLRLATGRTVRQDSFDVEAFAKVELPLWLSYELGGGRGTKSAATNLSKPKVSWYANTFKGWTESGGNGAAMRIQPHVWAARAPDNPENFLPDVIRNAVCTHSHPIGMMGAVLHALILAHTIASGRILDLDDTNAIIDIAASVPSLMQNDFEVWNFWRTAFEREAGLFVEEWERAVASSKDALRIASANQVHLKGAERYSAIVDNLMLRDQQNLGNGILTTIAALALTWCETRPEKALRIAANTIGTDTDTIATMAGAILGVMANAEPPVEVMDADLIRSEAMRLSTIAQARDPANHQYPNLSHWSAPKSRSDALMRGKSGNLYVKGLGLAEATSESIAAPKGNFMWQWLKLEFGQTVLIKRRDTLLQYDQDPKNLRTLPTPSDNSDPDKQKPFVSNDTIRSPVGGNSSQLAPKQPSDTSKRPVDIQGALSYIKERKGDDRAIGAALRGVVARGTRGQLAAFTVELIDYLREVEESKASGKPLP